MPGAKPVTMGHGFSTPAWIPDGKGSRSLPLLHERIAGSENRFRTMAGQLTEVSPKPSEDRPIVPLDAEYGCAPFLEEIAGLSADFIIRLRPNLCLRKAPGRRRKKGRRDGAPESTFAGSEDSLFFTVEDGMWEGKFSPGGKMRWTTGGRHPEGCFSPRDR